jgi:hypothetical protein
MNNESTARRGLREAGGRRQVAGGVVGFPPQCTRKEDLGGRDIAGFKRRSYVP